MPIPYRDQDELDELGIAAFLKLEAQPGGGGYRGALLQINARGEPLEFTFNHVVTPSGFLWRGDDLRRQALARLTASLFDACATVPTLICCLDAETPGALLRDDIQVTIPVCRVTTSNEPGIDPADAPSITWHPSAPPEGAATRLAGELGARQLLREPFERASAGLVEVFGGRGERWS